MAKLQSAFKEQNIMAGFKSSGIWPFDLKKTLGKLPTDQVETGTDISAILEDFEEVDLPAPESTAEVSTPGPEAPELTAEIGLSDFEIPQDIELEGISADNTPETTSVVEPALESNPAHVTNLALPFMTNILTIDIGSEKGPT